MVTNLAECITRSVQTSSEQFTAVQVPEEYSGTAPAPTRSRAERYQSFRPPSASGPVKKNRSMQ